MGADLFSGRYHLCPFCRVDLTPSIRRHIEKCALIRVEDPRWQDEAREATEAALRAREDSRRIKREPPDGR
jgi:hypothetical protein